MSRFSAFCRRCQRNKCCSKSSNVAMLQGCMQHREGDERVLLCCAELVGLSIEKVVNGSNPDPKRSVSECFMEKGFMGLETGFVGVFEIKY